MQPFARRCLVAAVLLTAAAAAVNAIWLRRAPEVTYHVTFREVPLSLAGLQGERVAVEQRVFEYLGADAMEELAYTAANQPPVRLTLVYGTDWRALHSPLSCYAGQGWRVDAQQEVAVTAPPGQAGGGPLRARLLRVHKGERRYLALYVFAYRGGTTSEWMSQIMAVNASPRGSGGVMLSASAPVTAGDEEAVQALLGKVLGEAYSPAVSFWYRP